MQAEAERETRATIQVTLWLRQTLHVSSAQEMMGQTELRARGGGGGSSPTEPQGMSGLGCSFELLLVALPGLAIPTPPLQEMPDWDCCPAQRVPVYPCPHRRCWPLWREAALWLLTVVIQAVQSNI